MGEFYSITFPVQSAAALLGCFIIDIVCFLKFFSLTWHDGGWLGSSMVGCRDPDNSIEDERLDFGTETLSVGTNGDNHK